MTKFNKILITGAAGGIGTILRSALHPHCELLRSSDIVDVEPATANEQSFSFDLRDRAATMKAMEGIDIVYHFGGIPAEDTWETIRDVNIEGTYNIYEAARLNGVKRVVFASSNHAMGFHRRETIVGQDEPTRPDSRYGVSKVFGEAVGNLYADKHGLETISLRIGQFRPKPTNRRMLSLWLSPADMGRLAVSCLTTRSFILKLSMASQQTSVAGTTTQAARKSAISRKTQLKTMRRISAKLTFKKVKSKLHSKEGPSAPMNLMAILMIYGRKYRFSCIGLFRSLRFRRSQALAYPRTLRD